MSKSIEQLLDRVLALVRMMDPGNGASDGERTNAASAIEAMWPRLVRAAQSVPEPTSRPATLLDRVDAAWREMSGRGLRSDERQSIRQFLRRGLSVESIVDAFDIASERVEEEAWFRYACGVCWKRIRGDDR